MTDTPLPPPFFNHSRQKQNIYLKDLCTYMLENAA